MKFIVKSNDEYPTFDIFKKFCNVCLSEIQLFINHIEIMKLIANGNDTYGIVIQNETSLGFVDEEEFCNFYDNFPKTWDILFVDSFCKSSKIAYKTMTQCPTDMKMYIISKQACLKILEIFEIEKEITMPIDFWFNYIGHKYKMQYYLSEPTMVG